MVTRGHPLTQSLTHHNKVVDRFHSDFVGGELLHIQAHLEPVLVIVGDSVRAGLFLLVRGWPLFGGKRPVSGVSGGRAQETGQNSGGAELARMETAPERRVEEPRRPRLVKVLVQVPVVVARHNVLYFIRNERLPPIFKNVFSTPELFAVTDLGVRENLSIYNCDLWQIFLPTKFRTLIQLNSRIFDLFLSFYRSCMLCRWRKYSSCYF